MKKLFLPVIALIATTVYVRAQSFEGSYLMHIESAQKKDGADMQITFKGNKSCMEMITAPNAGKVKTIFDKKEQTMTMVADKDGTNKMAMVRKMPDAAEYSGSGGKDAKITVTEETKKIEGYNCRKVIAENDESITEMWMTNDLGLTYSDMFGMMRSGRGPASNMTTGMQNYKDVKGMPLEMIIKNKTVPDDITHITLKNIKKGNVDDSIFDLSDYRDVHTN